jgi:hypothetical protein
MSPHVVEWPDVPARVAQRSTGDVGSGRPRLEIDEVQKIQVARGMPEAGQDHRRLAPMLGTVVHDVDHLLPQRVGPALALRVAVLDDPREIVVAEHRDEVTRVALDSLLTALAGVSRTAVSRIRALAQAL